MDKGLLSLNIPEFQFPFHQMKLSYFPYFVFNYKLQKSEARLIWNASYMRKDHQLPPSKSEDRVQKLSNQFLQLEISYL